MNKKLLILSLLVSLLVLVGIATPLAGKFISSSSEEAKSKCLCPECVGASFAPTLDTASQSAVVEFASPSAQPIINQAPVASPVSSDAI